jgi:nicotinic acid phosphoribosyltransferase
MASDKNYLMSLEKDRLIDMIQNLRKSNSRLHYLAENSKLLVDNCKFKIKKAARVLESLNDNDMPYSRNIVVKKNNGRRHT